MSIHVKTAAGWEELGVSGTPGELPGLGGWATITAVSGSPKRYAYPDPADPEWVAFEWTGDGTVTTTKGLADVLVVSGGGSAYHPYGAAEAQYGQGGETIYGLHVLPQGALTVTVGHGSTPGTGASTLAGFSAIETTGFDTLRTNAPLQGYAHRGPAASDGSHSTSGFTSNITNSPIVVGGIAETSNFGGGGGRPDDGKPASTHNGQPGVVIVRVPAAQAAGVDPGSYNDVTVRSVAKEKVKEAVKSRKKTKK